MAVSNLSNVCNLLAVSFAGSCGWSVVEDKALLWCMSAGLHYIPTVLRFLGESAIGSFWRFKFPELTKAFSM